MSFGPFRDHGSAMIAQKIELNAQKQQPFVLQQRFPFIHEDVRHSEL